MNKGINLGMYKSLDRNPCVHFPILRLWLNNANFSIIIFYIALDSSPLDPFGLIHNDLDSD